MKDYDTNDRKSNTNVHSTFVIGNLRWFAFYLALGVGFAFLIPFPLSFFALIGTILIVDVFRTRYILRKSGKKLVLSEFFKSLSSGGQLDVTWDQTPLRLYCMVCGKENPNIECEHCGSKMRRAGFI